MFRERVIRGALWTTVLLNAIGVMIFIPAAFGKESQLLPVAVSPYFAAQLGFVIALFGVVYAWLARQRSINRGLVVVGALGKLGFFALTLVYALAGEVPVSMAVNAAPDLVLGVVFLWWASDA